METRSIGPKNIADILYGRLLKGINGDVHTARRFYTKLEDMDEG